VELALPPAHRLARLNYAPRTAAFAFSFLTFGILWIERGRFNAWEVFSAVLTFLVYPHLAYLHTRIAVDSKRAELNNLYADSLLLGVWMAQIHFALWPSVGLLTAVSLNSAGHGYVGRLFRSLAVFGAGAGAWAAVIGYDFKPETGPVVTAACIFGILAYASWVGARVFIQNKNLVRARDALQTSEDQFRFIAENVTDLVSVLDTQGRFLYASSSYTKHFEPDAVGAGANWLLLVHPEDREQAKSFLNAVAASTSSMRMQLRLVSAKGSWRFVECQGNPVREKTGKPKMTVLVSHDLSAFLDTESDNRVSARLVTAAKREFVSVEKQLVIDLQDRLFGHGPNKHPQSGPPQQFKSVEDIHRYIEALAARKPEDDRRSRIWRSLQRMTLMVTLAGSFLNYYLLSVLDTIYSLPQSHFVVVRTTVKTSQIFISLRLT